MQKENEVKNTKEKYYSINEICLFLGIERHTVYRLIESGKLKAFAVTQRNTRIKESDLIEFIQQSKIEAV
jgi:excisionase family DNA binding protein